MERIKVVLQVDGQGGRAKQYKGPLDVISKLYQEGGLRSLYRGTAATLARDCPGSTAYFVAYEGVKKALTPAGADPNDLSIPAVITAGGLAGVAMWSFAIPPDVRPLFLGLSQTVGPDG